MNWDLGMRKRAGATLVLLLLGLVGAALPAAADPHSELDKNRSRQERVQKELERKSARASQLTSRVVVLDSERATVAAEVEKLNGKVAVIDTRIASVTKDLSRAQKEVVVLTGDLQKVLSKLESRTDVFTARAVAAYKAGPTAYLDSILTSESISELAERQAYYESALDSDSALVTEIQVLRDEIEIKRDRIIEEEERIAAAKRRLQSDRAEIAELRTARREVLAQQEAVLAQKSDLLSEVKRDKAKLARAEAQLEQDEQRILSIIQSGSSSSGPLPQGGGQLAWPAAGPVTSGYGYRTHPIFGDRRLHTGVDIGAPYGAPVVASANGRVVFAGTMSGYGNAIVVDHGKGLATTYNHLSGFSVGSGQQVSRGTPIGSVGCTGYCTGPHLHFEVRVNGTPTDPMPYLQ